MPGSKWQCDLSPTAYYPLKTILTITNGINVKNLEVLPCAFPFVNHRLHRNPCSVSLERIYSFDMQDNLALGTDNDIGSYL